MKGDHLLQAPHFQSKHVWLLAGCICLVNLLLKSLFLSAQDIAMDEPFTLFWAQRPIGDILDLAKDENTPPLHYLIEHCWIKLFGMEPVSVRFPSLIFSSLCAAVVFRTAHREWGVVAGMGASLIFTLSTEHIYYSHEARTYPLIALLTALSVNSYLAVAAAPRETRQYVWLGIWNILLIYSHFLGFWVLLAQVGCWLLLRDKKATALRFLVMYGAVIVAYLPNLYVFVMRLRSVSTVGTWVPDKPHWTQLYGHINIFWNGPWATVACIILIVAGIVGWTYRRQLAARLRELWKGDRTVLVLTGLFLSMYGGIYLQSLFFNSAFIPRYLIFTSVPFFLLVAGLMTHLFRNWKVQAMAFGVLALAMLSGFQLNPPNHRAVKAMAAYVQTQRHPGSVVVIAPDYFDKTYLYHADLELFQSYDRLRPAEHEKGIYPVNDFASIPAEVLRAAGRVIYVDADTKFVFPENDILQRLHNIFPKVEHRQFEGPIDVYVLGNE